MRTALKIFSIICVIIGGLAVLGSMLEPDSFGLIGGGLFLTEGILALVYMQSKKPKKEEEKIKE